MKALKRGAYEGEGRSAASDELEGAAALARAGAGALI
ncbi:hypothetical protein SLEP1_g31107 [Rubroshorea leprosula]|uniref:Uncharacterized protein n=1 Tax=Rubroshorea leprosula TaxID=152421 RepID=A0AAV5KAV4_9ROSI|nr:hypothetical protein SLEP1_g31107 [Rubroshorea leprosula]